MKKKYLLALAAIILLSESAIFAVGSWVNPTPTASIGNRGRHQMTFDSSRNRVYLYGGSYVTRAYATSLWYYDGMDWIMETPGGTAPAGRDYPAFVYIPTTDDLFVFGGYNGTYLNDVWLCQLPAISGDPVNWTTVDTSICSEAPSSRRGHVAVWDPSRSKIIVFGGNNASTYYNEVWEYDPSVDPASTCPWTKRQPAPTPTPGIPSLAYSSMVYDSSRDLTIIFGGRNSTGIKQDTWEYNPATNAFVLRNCGSHVPDPLAKMAFGYDSNLEVALLFGGESPAKDRTWEYNPGVPGWYESGLDYHPSARSDTAMAFDSSRSAFVLFGGISSSFDYLSDTWEYRVFATPTPSPTPVPVPATSGAGSLSLLFIFTISILIISIRKR